MKSLTPYQLFMASRSFTLFKKLPLDVRHMIWHRTLEPHIVKIEMRGRYMDKQTGLCSNTELPVALVVCRESRKAVEYFYPCCFGCALIPGITRFDFVIDTLYLTEEFIDNSSLEFITRVSQKELLEVRYVAIDGPSQQYETLIWDRVSLFLKSLAKPIELALIQEPYITLGNICYEIDTFLARSKSVKFCENVGELPMIPKEVFQRTLLDFDEDKHPYYI